MIGPREECTRAAIGAHSIPRPRLRLIADKHRKVLIMTPDLRKLASMAKSSGAVDKLHDVFERRSISNWIMTAPMACAVHDRDVFSAIENAELDPSAPDHCLVLAYRSALFDLQKKRVSRRLLKSLSILDADLLPALHMAIGGVHTAELAKFQIESEILASSAANSQLEHRHYSIDSPPMIAATTLIIRGGNSHLFPPHELDALGRLGLPRAPEGIWIAVTVYPDRDGHIVTITFPKGTESVASTVVPAIRARGEQEFSALMSKTLLEEAENVMVSPSVWRSFGDAKRKRLVQHFMGFLPRAVAISSPAPLSEREVSEIVHAHQPDSLVERDPEEVNLFS